MTNLKHRKKRIHKGVDMCIFFVIYHSIGSIINYVNSYNIGGVIRRIVRNTENERDFVFSCRFVTLVIEYMVF